MVAIDAVLDGLMRFKWVSDHVRSISDLGPRHIGRPVSFDYFTSDDLNDYDSIRVLGLFEGYHGGLVLVSGEEYDWSNVKSMKVWRSEVSK